VTALEAKATADDRSIYLRKYNSWNLLKRWLSGLSEAKCWYCESKSKRAPFDVDHFRPKLGVTVNRVELSNGFGYYWIAYDWCNFRLACQRCNRPETDDGGTLRGKANEFPLRDEAARCRGPDGCLTAEIPKLLDPCVEADCALLAHGLDGEVKPAAPAGTWDHDRARYAIDLLGFNEWNAPEDRRNEWQRLSILINLVPAAPTQAVIDCLHSYLSPSQEYSRFFRSVIGAHRDKSWVANLL
jgi:uncharacterized protein (TIGR02646 family)